MTLKPRSTIAGILFILFFQTVFAAAEEEIIRGRITEGGDGHFQTGLQYLS